MTALKPAPVFLIRISRAYISLALPFLIALCAIRLVMTPLFLQFEYNRADFPEDYYGFTTEERLMYAPYALNYLLNGDDISYLGDLTLPDGKAMYNTRELHHMRDVKTVTQTAYLLTFIGGLIVCAASFYLWRTSRPALRNAYLGGGIFTIAIIAAIIIAAVINWDFFFTGFHTLFFSSGTWRFEYSDTLIRLFPEQFWFDAALTIGVLSSLTALITFIVSWKRGSHT